MGLNKIIPGLVASPREAPRYKLRWEYDKNNYPIKAHGKEHYAVVQWDDRYFESWDYSCHKNSDGSVVKEADGGSSGINWLQRCVRRCLRQLDGYDWNCWVRDHHTAQDWIIRHHINGTDDLIWRTYWCANPGYFNHRAKYSDGITINVGYTTYMGKDDDVAWVQVFDGREGYDEYTAADRHYRMKGRKDFIKGIKEVTGMHRALVKLREEGRNDEADLLIMKNKREEKKNHYALIGLEE